MHEQNYKDCYARFDGKNLIVGNHLIQRTFELKEGRLQLRGPIKPNSGWLWGNEETEAPFFPDFGLSLEGSSPAFTAQVQDHYGLSKPFLKAVFKRTGSEGVVSLHISLFPDQPFISLYWEAEAFGERALPTADEPFPGDSATGIETTPPITPSTASGTSTDTVDFFVLPPKGHYKVKNVALYDKTDRHDTLVLEKEQLLYSRESLKLTGNLFLINDYGRHRGLLLVKEAPTPSSAINYPGYDLMLHNGQAALSGTGIDLPLKKGNLYRSYGATLGLGAPETLFEQYKSFYREVFKGDPSGASFIMSNTWGDRNQDAAVCEAFIYRELDTAHRLGVDIVQIDDGWQKGITSNSKLKTGGVWEGYHKTDPEFWSVNSDKFPNGLKPLSDYARERGIRLGLWFSPDSSEDFCHWEKDSNLLVSYYETCGIDCFKLDGVKIRNKRAEANYLKFLEAVTRRSNGQIAVNQDITAEDRLGYLYEKQYGTLFVENRYTDWGNYYPHNTLKNLWSLNRYLPACKFQFELLNNTRNRPVYEGDPFAPGLYSMDYLFASVMIANPLLWMELGSLPDKEIETLKNIIAVYKKERNGLFAGQTFSIGDMPDGTAFTGFQTVTGPGEGYLILFREKASDCRCSFGLRPLKALESPAANWKFHLNVLATNLKEKDFEWHFEQKKSDTHNGLSVRMEATHSFVFARYLLKSDF